MTLPKDAPQMDNPLHQLSFPVSCRCGDGPFANAIEVDEHITADHLPEAVWDYAHDNMIPEASK